MRKDIYKFSVTRAASSPNDIFLDAWQQAKLEETSKGTELQWIELKDFTFDQNGNGIFNFWAVLGHDKKNG